MLFQHGHGPRARKIFVSGPLLDPSGDFDQMLKERDRQIQEHSRRARLDRARVEKVPHGGKQITNN